MKRMYLFLSTLFALAPGIAIAMDNQGQALMQAIIQADVAGVQEILNQGFINVCQKIGDQSPIEMACRLQDSNIIPATVLVNKSLIDYAFDHVVEITADEHPEAKIAHFVDLMTQCRMDHEETIRRILCTCAAQKDAFRQIRTLLGGHGGRSSRDNLNEFHVPKGFLRNCTDLLSNLLENYPNGTDEFDDAQSIVVWIIRCIQYGAPIDMPNKAGITPLGLAVQQKDFKLELITVLLARGADPSRKFIYEGMEYTAVTFLENSTRKDSVKLYALRYLKKELPNDLPPIWYQNIKEPPRNLSKTGTVFFASLVTAIGLYAGYKWITSGSAKHAQNMIINETGNDIIVLDQAGYAITIHPGENNTGDLPKFVGVLTIRILGEDKNTNKNLNIDLSQYEDDLDDYYINITIRPTRWYESVFIKTPLTYSVRWKRRSAAQEAK